MTTLVVSRKAFIPAGVESKVQKIPCKTRHFSYFQKPNQAFRLFSAVKPSTSPPPRCKTSCTFQLLGRPRGLPPRYPGLAQVLRWAMLRSIACALSNSTGEKCVSLSCWACGVLALWVLKGQNMLIVIGVIAEILMPRLGLLGTASGLGSFYCGEAQCSSSFWTSINVHRWLWAQKTERCFSLEKAKQWVS